MHRLRDTVEAPYDTCTQPTMRRMLDEHEKTGERVRIVIDLVEELSPFVGWATFLLRAVCRA